MQISLDLPQKSLFYSISKCSFTKVLPKFLEPWYKINFCYLPFAVFADGVLVGWSKRLKQIIEIKHDGVKNTTSRLFITVPGGGGGPMSPTWILNRFVSVFINACCLLSDFILRAVATFWAMSLVAIYPGRASVRAGLELGTSDLQVQRPNRSATLPPVKTHIYNKVLGMTMIFFMPVILT